MSKTEAIEIFAKSIFNEEKKVISSDEFSALVEKAETQQECDFYRKRSCTTSDRTWRTRGFMKMWVCQTNETKKD